MKNVLASLIVALDKLPEEHARAFISNTYLNLVGYDLFEDSPDMTLSEGKKMMFDVIEEYFREIPE